MKILTDTDEFQKRFLSLEFKDKPLIQYRPRNYTNIYYLPFLAFGMPDQIWSNNLHCFYNKFTKKGKPYKTPRRYVYRYWKAISELVGYKFDSSFSIDTFDIWMLETKMCDYAFEIPKDSILMELVKSGKRTHANLRKMARNLDKELVRDAREFIMRQGGDVKKFDRTKHKIVTTFSVSK